VGSYRLLDEVSGAVAGNYVKRHTAFSVRPLASEANFVAASQSTLPRSLPKEGGITQRYGKEFYEDAI